jgi:hypothetical protein
MRVAPEHQLIAAVVRFSAEVHGMAKPAKMNFYFRAPGEKTILRVGFENADQNAIDVKPYDDEDGLSYEQLKPLGEYAIAWTEALHVGEDNGGRVFRNSGRTWKVRVILAQEPEFDFPTYHVWYSSPIGPPVVDVLLDATTGASEFDPSVRFSQAKSRARSALGGPVDLVTASASWSSSSALPTGFGTDRPTTVGLTFVRSDVAADLRSASVFFAAGGIQPQIRRFDLPKRPPAIAGDVDLIRAFAAVEEAGGRALREQWTRDGLGAWQAFANAGSLELPGQVLPSAPDNMSVTVSYQTALGDRAPVVFRYDLATKRVTRVS